MICGDVDHVRSLHLFRNFACIPTGACHFYGTPIRESVDLGKGLKLVDFEPLKPSITFPANAATTPTMKMLEDISVLTMTFPKNANKPRKLVPFYGMPLG